MKKHTFLIIIILLSSCSSVPTQTPTPLSCETPTPQPNATAMPVFTATATSTQVTTPTVLPLAIPDEIITLLDTYFEMRYESLQNLDLGDFNSLIVEETQNFWKVEKEKLALEIEHARIYQLAYLDYEFYLDYKDILVDPSGQNAKIFLSEGHDVVFEISAPIFSEQRNIVHEIDLIQIDGQWKIASDKYADYLWRWLLIAEISPAELRNELIALQEKRIENILHQSLPTEKVSYDRQGAVDYAQQWAIAPPPYNPNYFDFSNLGGDCTNFVSQAIFEGGGIQMVFGGVHDIGTPGWYYHDINDRSMAWTWVDSLHNFIIKEQNIWDNTMIGYEISAEEALAGDIMQFNWGRDDVWNHSVLVVSAEDNLTLIAGHSPDVDNYPHTAMIYSDAFRFIHIASD